MEEWVKKCYWRKEVDENMKRLHSLLFGAESHRDADDYSSAYILSLRLLGFLDSRSHSETHQAFIQHIRTRALSYLHTAGKSLTPSINR